MDKGQLSSQICYNVIGMMSGTSLDGVDLAYCEFIKKQTNQTENQISAENSQISPSLWKFRLIAAETYQYPEYILDTINTMQAESTTFLKFKQKQLVYSKFLVETINLFKNQKQIQSIDLISVHGHTVFHQPESKLTVQMTNLSYLAANLKMDVIGNFRELDVLRGCQGAPLAPYGEQIFSGQAFINFGGIANISHKGKGYDINFCNLFLNHMSKLISNKQYDQNGNIGRNGTPRQDILKHFREFNIFKPGQSLARQHFEPYIQNTLHTLKSHKNQDILASYYYFLAQSIDTVSKQLIKQPEIEIVCSGGGAKNSFLLELLNKKSQFKFVIPDDLIIDFKEAIIFAFLGLKFLEGQRNCETGIGGNLVKGSALCQKLLN